DDTGPPAVAADLLPRVRFRRRSDCDLFGPVGQPLDDHPGLHVPQPTGDGLVAQDVAHQWRTLHVRPRPPRGPGTASTGLIPRPGSPTRHSSNVKWRAYTRTG